MAFVSSVWRNSTRSVGRWLPLYRSLFTDQSLGLDGFDALCDNQRKMRLPKDRFWKRVDHYNHPTSKMLIFSADVQRAITLAESAKEINDVTNLCEKYQQQSERIGLFVYHFSPVLMRLLHRRSCTQHAYAQLTENTQAHLYLSSFKIAMDLLFNKGEYKKVLDLWQVYSKTESLSSKTPYPRSMQILIPAACYRMNTAESYEFALEFLKECAKNVAFVQRKGLVLISALAFNQGHVDMAFEVISLIKSNDLYLPTRSVKLMILAKLERFVEALQLVECLLEADIPIQDYHDREICFESLKVLMDEVAASDDKESKESLHRMEQLLIDGGHVARASLDQVLLAPVISAPTSPEVIEQMALEEQAHLLPSEDLTLDKLTQLTYKDDSQELDSVENFQQTENLHKRRDKLLKTAVDHVMAEGPLEPEDDKEADAKKYRV